MNHDQPYDERQFLRDDEALARSESRQAARELRQDRTPPVNLCESCHEPSNDLEAVEDHELETGYRAVSVVCRSCRTHPHDGGLRVDALKILGVDENWLEQRPTRKPATRETRPSPAIFRKPIVGGVL